MTPPFAAPPSAAPHLHESETQSPFVHDGPPETGRSSPPEPDPIRIYVACLAAYNNGQLHGVWIEVGDEAAIWEAVRAMLSRSPIEEDAEEWAIHDYEGFEGADIEEYTAFADVAVLAEYIRERGRLGAKVLNYYGGNIEDAQSRFEDYRGDYDSLADYAREITEESGAAIPESLSGYIDYAAMAHDWDMSGDLLTFIIGGSVHIFGAA